MRSRILRLVGLFAFLVSFFLPAVNMGDSTNPNPVRGWLCAVSALLFTAAITHLFEVSSFSEALYEVFGLLSGWVNILTLIYLVLAFRGRRPRLRRRILGYLLVCLLATLGFFVNAMMATGSDMPVTVLLFGYFVWVGGILLMAIPDLALLHPAREREVTTSPHL